MDYFPYANKAADQMMNVYISKMESYLKCKRIDINVAQTWQKVQPDGVTASIFDYLSTVQSQLPNYLLLSDPHDRRTQQ